MILDDDWRRADRRARAARPRVDLAAERRMREARRPLRRIGVDAALMIHEDGATTDEARAYLARWRLSRPSRRSTRSASSPTRRGAPT